MSEIKNMERSFCLTIFGLLILIPSIPLPHDLFLRDQHFIWLIFYAGAIFMGFALLISKEKLSLPIPVFIPFILMATGYLLGLFVARQMDTAFLEITRIFALGVLIIATGLIVKSKSDILFLSKFVVLSLLMHSIYGLYELLTIENVLKGITGVPGHANVYAYLIVVTYPLAVGLGLDKNTNRFWRILAWVSVVSALVMIPFTWSAGAVLALVLPWMVLGLYTWVKRYRKTTIGIMVAGVVTIVGVTMWLLNEGKVSVSARTEMIEIANKLIDERPITGIGPGQLVFRYPDFRSIDNINYPGYTAKDPRDHIHLEPLQTYMDAGIFGVLGLIQLLFLLVPRSLKRAKDENGLGYSKLIWLSLAAALIQGAVSLAPSRQGAIVLALALGLALSQLKMKSLQKSVKPALVVLLLCIIAGSFYQVKRVQADYYYAKGRDPEKFWTARDWDALRKVSEIWPEELEAKNLLTTSLYRTMITLPPGAEQSQMINEGLKLTEQTMEMSPQYQKVPVLRAAYLMVEGDTLSAYNTLINADRFINDPYYQKLLRSAKKCVSGHTE